MSLKIVGIGCYSRTGKDSFANYLKGWIEQLSPDTTVNKIPFAWKLKDICHQLYGWAGHKEPDFYDTPEGEKYRDIPLKKIGMTPVELWVAMGTPAIRENVYENTWIDFVLNSHATGVLVIPDVRFPNEVAAIRERSGTLIKIVRPGVGPRDTVADRALLGYDGWDYVFGSTGKLQDLDQDAWRFARHLLGEKEFVQTVKEKRKALSVEVLS